MKLIFDNQFIEKVKHLIGKHKKLEDLNQFLELQTGIKNFFYNYNDLNDFKKFLNVYTYRNKNRRADLGDFQTPLDLTDKICEYFIKIGVYPEVILEPTCGGGNFIISAIKCFPSLKYIYCVEIQPFYEWLFKLNILKLSFEKNIDLKIEFYRDNIFTHRFSGRFLNLLKKKNCSFLIIGNPPWITNTELSLLNSKNLPIKSNIKKVKGLEALTGSANFDIAESIILKIIQTFNFTRGTLGMLCKATVMKNIVRDIDNLNLKLSNLHCLNINSKKEFSIATDSGLFFANLGKVSEKYCITSSLYEPEKVIRKFGWFNKKFVSNIDIYKNYKDLDGESPLEWRQGVKHDAIDIFILTEENEGFYSNGLGNLVDIEDDLLYPFVKGSDLREYVIRDTKLKVVITQKFLNQNTNYISKQYPKTWKYLTLHSDKLDARKSKIYRNSKNKFSIFGIGDYSFKPFKIAIAGFYKKAIFALLFPVNGKPIIVDDTCYQIGFENFRDAILTWILLNLNDVKDFLSSIIFIENKRPYTKKVLMRIGLLKLLDRISFIELKDFYDKNLRFYCEYRLNEKEYEKYKHKFNKNLINTHIDSFF